MKIVWLCSLLLFQVRADDKVILWSPSAEWNFKEMEKAGILANSLPCKGPETSMACDVSASCSMILRKEFSQRCDGYKLTWETHPVGTKGTLCLNPQLSANRKAAYVKLGPGGDTALILYSNESALVGNSYHYDLWGLTSCRPEKLASIDIPSEDNGPNTVLPIAEINAVEECKRDQKKDPQIDCFTKEVRGEPKPKTLAWYIKTLYESQADANRGAFLQASKNRPTFVRFGKRIGIQKGFDMKTKPTYFDTIKSPVTIEEE